MLEIKRIAAFVLAAIMLLGLSACGQMTAAGEVLIKPVESRSESANLRLADVTYGSVSRIFSDQDGSLRYDEVQVNCDIDNAKFAEFAVKSGDMVEEGDLLARFTVGYSPADEQSLEAELQIAATAANRQKSSAAEAAAAARAALAGYSGDDTRTRRRLELAAERADIYKKMAEQSADASVKAAQKALDDFRETMSKTEIFAPVSGYVSNMEFRTEGAAVPKGSRICTIIDSGNMSLVGSGGTSARYGMPAEVQAWMLGVEVYDSVVVAAPNVTGGGQEFKVAIPDGVIERMAASAAGELYDTGARMLQRSMGIRLAMERFRLDNVVVVPNGAVSIDDGKRFVYVLRDGELKKRYIAVGLSDDQYTQVLDGVEPGERVSVG